MQCTKLCSIVLAGVADVEAPSIGILRMHPGPKLLHALLLLVAALTEHVSTRRGRLNWHVVAYIPSLGL